MNYCQQYLQTHSRCWWSRFLLVGSVVLALTIGCKGKVIPPPLPAPPAPAPVVTPPVEIQPAVTPPAEVAPIEQPAEVPSAEATAPAPSPPTAAAPVERMLLLTRQGPLLIDLEITVEGEPLGTALEKLAAVVLLAADVDHDGRPTWAELVKHPVFRDGLYGNLPIASPENEKDVLQRYDANRNGTVDLEELPRFLTRNAGSARPLSVRGSLDINRESIRSLPTWNLLNTDDDPQELSAAEMLGAGSRLRLKDDDEDDRLTLADLSRRNNLLPGQASPRARTVRNGPYTCFVIHSGTKWDSVWLGLADWYALGGKLKPEHFGITRSLFAYLDENGDGKLTKGEIARLATAPAALRLRVSFGGTLAEGQPFSGQLMIELLELSAELQQQGFQATSPTGKPAARLTLAGPQLELRLAASDQVQGLAASQAEGERLLATYDQDKNGYLELSEIPEQARAALPLASVDKDGDGKLYVAEIVAFLAQRQAPQRAQVHAKGELHEDSLFALLDANGDDLLDGQELLGTADRLQKYDSNQNGSLAPEEVPPVMTLLLARGDLQNPAALFVPAPLPPPVPGTEVARWFTQMDTSGDGLLSPREFLGEISLFERLDTNGDGYLSWAEAAGGKDKAETP